MPKGSIRSPRAARCTCSGAATRRRGYSGSTPEFSGVLGDVKLEWITPFKHLDAAAIVQNAAYDTPLVLLNVAVSLVALAASYWLYIRRDIPAVS